MYVVKLITKCGVYAEKLFLMRWRAQAFRDSVFLRCREIDVERVAGLFDRIAMAVPVMMMAWVLVCTPCVALAEDGDGGSGSAESSEVDGFGDGSEGSGGSGQSGESSNEQVDYTLGDVVSRLDAVTGYVDQLENKADAVNDSLTLMGANVADIARVESSSSDYSGVLNEQVAGDFFFVMLVDTALLVLVLGALAFLAFKPR